MLKTVSDAVKSIMQNYGEDAPVKIIAGLTAPGTTLCGKAKEVLVKLADNPTLANTYEETDNMSPSFSMGHHIIYAKYYSGEKVFSFSVQVGDHIFYMIEKATDAGEAKAKALMDLDMICTGIADVTEFEFSVSVLHTIWAQDLFPLWDGHRIGED